MRNISCSHTADAVRTRMKTVTRRQGWKDLKEGELLRVVEKSMGLKKGEKIKALAVVRVVSVSFEQVGLMIKDNRMIYRSKRAQEIELTKEGFPLLTAKEFVDFFCKTFKAHPQGWVTRIEWAYEDRCLACGFEVGPGSELCGECSCEEDGM